MAYNPPIGSIYHLYNTYIPCRTWGVIYATDPTELRGTSIPTIEKNRRSASPPSDPSPSPGSLFPGASGVACCGTMPWIHRWRRRIIVSTPGAWKTHSCCVTLLYCKIIYIIYMHMICIYIKLSQKTLNTMFERICIYIYMLLYCIHTCSRIAMVIVILAQYKDTSMEYFLSFLNVYNSRCRIVNSVNRCTFLYRYCVFLTAGFREFRNSFHSEYLRAFDTNVVGDHVQTQGAIISSCAYHDSL